MIGRAQIGLTVCSSLYLWLQCVICSLRLGLVYRCQKAMQILPFTKWHSAYTVQMGNLQTNSSWSWMRYWQSPNSPRTIRVWLQLTTPANEFPRWDSRARQTTWRPLTTTEPLLYFYTGASRMHRLAADTEWNVPTMLPFSACAHAAAALKLQLLLLLLCLCCTTAPTGEELIHSRNPWSQMHTKIKL